MKENNIKLSIVTTLFYSSPYIIEFYQKISSVAKKITDDYEIIFVNDGSPDNSLEIVLDLYKKDTRIKIIDLSRNFGHHYAISAGLSYSSGNYVFLIDCDLEVSPLILFDFYNKINKTNADVVYGFQEKRKGKFIENNLGGWFWKTINVFSDVDIPYNVLTERLMSRKYVDSLMKLGDKNLFLAGMMYWTGFVQIGIPVKKNQCKEKSTYSFSRRIKLAVEAITSFSVVPLKLMFNFGIIITLISIISGTYLITKKILNPSEILVGYTSTMILIVFTLGIIVSSLGLIGIYLSKMYIQTKNRPLYIIKNIYS